MVEIVETGIVETQEKSVDKKCSYTKVVVLTTLILLFAMFISLMSIVFNKSDSGSHFWTLKSIAQEPGYKLVLSGSAIALIIFSVLAAGGAVTSCFLLKNSFSESYAKWLLYGIVLFTVIILVVLIVGCAVKTGDMVTVNVAKDSLQFKGGYIAIIVITSLCGAVATGSSAFGTYKWLKA